MAKETCPRCGEKSLCRVREWSGGTLKYVHDVNSPEKSSYQPTGNILNVRLECGECGYTENVYGRGGLF